MLSPTKGSRLSAIPVFEENEGAVNSLLLYDVLGSTNPKSFFDHECLTLFSQNNNERDYFTK